MYLALFGCCSGLIVTVGIIGQSGRPDSQKLSRLTFGVCDRVAILLVTSVLSWLLLSPCTKQSGDSVMGSFSDS